MRITIERADIEKILRILGIHLNSEYARQARAYINEHGKATLCIESADNERDATRDIPAQRQWMSQ